MAEDKTQAAPGAQLDPGLRDAMRAVAAQVPVDDGGGGSMLKSLVLGELAVVHGLQTVVEIGVYRGRILLPLAVAMARQGGQAVGIDPYSADEAVQTDDHGRGIDLAAWAHGVDWEGLHRSVLEGIDRHGLRDHCRLVRATSVDAAAEFAPASIDLLHVDGNHDRAAVERDVALYLPKVRPGGFVVLDDASWPSVRPTLARLLDEHELIFQLFDGGAFVDGVGGNDFAVLRLSAG